MDIGHEGIDMQVMEMQRRSVFGVQLLCGAKDMGTQDMNDGEGQRFEGINQFSSMISESLSSKAFISHATSTS